MRRELRERLNRRGQFSATFKRFGRRPAGRNYPSVPTVLLLAIKDEHGTVVADHVWMLAGKQVMALNLHEGDEIFFNARVTRYWKRNPEAVLDDDEPERIADYRLSNPSGLRKLGADALRSLPLFEQGEQV